ncbi:hypothetical protein C0J52_26523 [Blattella germanica]|nr:hypothetical protein C0J52_26523 [Blattella germanica]
MALLNIKLCFLAIVTVSFLGTAHCFFLPPNTPLFEGTWNCDNGTCKINCHVRYYGFYEGICHDKNGQNVACTENSECPDSCFDVCRDISISHTTPTE